MHVDVKKLGAIRPGGGWWAHGQGSAAQHHTRTENRAGRRIGHHYVHCAIDDHTRLAYAEIHADETAATCADFLRAAAAWFARHGIGRIERVMTDNAKAYRVSHAWREALADIGAQPRFTRAYRPHITAPTPHSVATHRSAGPPSTTVLVNTARGRLALRMLARPRGPAGLHSAHGKARQGRPAAEHRSSFCKTVK